MFNSLSDKIIKLIFETAVKTIVNFSSTEHLERKHETYRLLEKGTVGRAVADCLDQHGYTFVPGFESHDLKHVLLGYDMTPMGETRLQAFMIGNGNVTVPSVLIFIIGVVFKPFTVRTYWADFQKGQAYPSVKEFSLDDVHLIDIEVFKLQLAKESSPSTAIIGWGSLVTASAYLFITLGVLGLNSRVLLPVDATLLVTGLFGLSIGNKNSTVASGFTGLKSSKSRLLLSPTLPQT